MEDSIKDGLLFGDDMSLDEVETRLNNLADSTELDEVE